MEHAAKGEYPANLPKYDSFVTCDCDESLNDGIKNPLGKNPGQFAVLISFDGGKSSVPMIANFGTGWGNGFQFSHCERDGLHHFDLLGSQLFMCVESKDAKPNADKVAH